MKLNAGQKQDFVMALLFAFVSGVNLNFSLKHMTSTSDWFWVVVGAILAAGYVYRFFRVDSKLVPAEPEKK